MAEISRRMPSRLILVIGSCSTNLRMPYKLIVVIVDGPCYPIFLFQARLGDAESTVKVGRTHYLKSHPVLAMK